MGRTYRPRKTCAKPRQARDVTCVAFSRDGKQIVGGCWSKAVYIWDAESGGEKLTLKGYGDAVMSVAFSPDGKRIAIGSADGALKIWEATAGQELLAFNARSVPCHAWPSAETASGSSAAARIKRSRFGTPPAARKRHISKSQLTPKINRLRPVVS